uniref:Uncharacterized protein n=1 Tax=Rhizophora mucronata TaxID=61149 RepID=A0A2P2P2J7_RHIMU
MKGSYQRKKHKGQIVIIIIIVNESCSKKDNSQ